MAINILPLDASSGSPVFTAQQTRQALSPLFGAAPSGRPLGATSGVRQGTPTTTVFLTGAGSTTWNVAAHSGVLDTQTAAAAGPYGYSTDGTDAGSITAADATNPRVDIVYVRVNDNVQDGSGFTNGEVGYLAGTPAATPSAPATPARAMVLATISVPKVGAGAPAVSWVAPTFNAPAWTSYSMAWTAVTTSPTIGNGTLTAAWTEARRMVTVRFAITLGSTTTRGSGSYRFSLPVPAASNYSIWQPIGTAVVRDLSPAARYAGLVCTTDDPTVALLMMVSDGSIVSESNPITLANTDQIFGSFSYERA